MRDEAKSKRTRSPAYPAIGLEEAIAKASTLWQKNNRHAAALETASEQWGYDKNSSTGGSVAAALLKYGLITDDGTGASREIKLTEDAIRLTYNPDTNSPEYQRALKKAALMPNIHAELWKKYSGEIPDDAVVKRYLVVERKFNEQYVESFIEQFKTTIKFANLKKGDIVVEDGEIKEVEIPLLRQNSMKETKQPASSMADSFSHAFRNPPTGIENAPLPFGLENVEYKKVLANYSVPLGDNIATITFSGDRLAPEDFDALSEYVLLFKKQYERKLKAPTSFGQQRIVGAIATTPVSTGNRVTFRLASDDGRDISCLSGAGLKVSLSDFVKGQRLFLVGENKADLVLGETPYFVFSEYGK